MENGEGERELERVTVFWASALASKQIIKISNE